MGAQRLCSMLAESVSRSLAARWKEGHHSFVQAMLLLPDASSASTSEQQVRELRDLIVIVLCFFYHDLTGILRNPCCPP